MNRTGLRRVRVNTHGHVYHGYFHRFIDKVEQDHMITGSKIEGVITLVKTYALVEMDSGSVADFPLDTHQLTFLS